MVLEEVPSPKPIQSGFLLFQKEFFSNGNKFDNVRKQSKEVGKAWEQLTQEEKNRYSEEARQSRPKKMKAKHKVPFHTRCSLRQFKLLAEYVNENESLRSRVESMGLSKLLKLQCERLPRDLIVSVLRSYDPPTHQFKIRDKIEEIKVEDVQELLGIPHVGEEVRMDVNDDDPTYKILRSKFGKVPYSNILADIKSGQQNDQFEFLFVLYTLGTFLSPTSSPSVSDRLLKVMCRTMKGFEHYDWATYIMNDLWKEMGDYVKVFRKKKAGSCNVGGCLYLLLIYFCERFPLTKAVDHDSSSAIQYWTEQRIKEVVKKERTRNTWSAVAHVITGVIGAGVLSLAWSMAQLGWIAGPVSIILFAITTLISVYLLSDCYRFPDPVTGAIRNPSYVDAVSIYLGETNKKVCTILVNESLCGTTIAYVFTTASSVRAILKSNCYHKYGHHAPCHYGETMFMVLFGVVQFFMSFIPDLHNMAWLSVVAAAMSFTYSFIGLGLGIAKVIENGTIKGSITGVATTSAVEKLWLVFQAIGDIAFAFPYSVLLLEIQDTLKSPPPENQTMKKASMIAVLITTFFYLCCGCFGYAAFGSDTPGNLLTGFGFYEPYWLVDLANACVVVHLVGGYQMFSQPLFAAADRYSSRRFPNSNFVNKSYQVKPPFLPGFQLSLFRLCFRTVYVIFTTGIAILFPYFNQVLGVLGGLNFWPLTIYFPVEMYFVQKKVGAWTKKWILLRSFSFVCFVVSVMGFVGSIEGIIKEKLSS